MHTTVMLKGKKTPQIIYFIFYAGLSGDFSTFILILVYLY